MSVRNSSPVSAAYPWRRPSPPAPERSAGQWSSRPCPRPPVAARRPKNPPSANSAAPERRSSLPDSAPQWPSTPLPRPGPPTAGASATAGAAAISSAPIRAAIVSERCSFTCRSLRQRRHLRRRPLLRRSHEPPHRPPRHHWCPRSATGVPTWVPSASPSPREPPPASPPSPPSASPPEPQTPAPARRGTTGAPITARP